ncbi:MAG TPA: hypothetical protein DDW65_01800, partial [Firmicutes bacterium]|nr:hypothetical protein [Bacillota bacterium]
MFIGHLLIKNDGLKQRFSAGYNQVKIKPAKHTTPIKVQNAPRAKILIKNATSIPCRIELLKVYKQSV